LKAVQHAGVPVRYNGLSVEQEHPESASILVVDDDVRLCQLIAESFSGTGYVIQAVHDGPTGLARAVEGRFDLVLLDVMLPGLDGFEVLTQLRRRSAVPVIMLTARGAREDRVIGLNAGADDYLPKPFGPEELAARIAAVLRRSRHTLSSKPETISVGRLRLSAATRRAWAADEPIDITATEFDILDLLVRADGRVVTRDEVCGMLYQRQATPFERAIEVHISRLRKKTEGTGVVIRSVRGVGYLLAGDETP
jgi:two-component system, OmpR family, response regulator CpxR